MCKNPNTLSRSRTEPNPTFPLDVFYYTSYIGKFKYNYPNYVNSPVYDDSYWNFVNTSEPVIIENSLKKVTLLLEIEKSLNLSDPITGISMDVREHFVNCK